MATQQHSALILTTGTSASQVALIDENRLATTLQDSGFTIYTALADTNGMTVLQTRQPALVILACPVTSALVETIRSTAANVQILAIVPNIEIAITSALSAGVDDCLTTPVYPALLRTRASLLAQRAEAQGDASRTVFDYANDAIFIEDLRSGTFMDVNRQAAESLGYTREELLSMRFRDIRAGRDHANSQEVKQNLTTRGELIFEDAYRTRDGRIIPVEVSSRIVYFNGKRAVASFARNIAQRKRIQAAEHEQRAFAEALVESAAVLSDSLQLNEVVRQILQQVKRVVPGDAANIMLIESGHAHVVGHQGYESRPARGGLQMEYDLTGAWLISKIVAHGEAAVLPDVRHHPDLWTAPPDGEWIQSYIGAPIYAEDEIIGVLSLDDSRPGFFNSDHLVKLQAFANLAGSAMRNALLYRALHKHAEQLDTQVQLRTAELMHSNLELRQEIADRHRAERLLANERNLLQTVVDNLPDHIYVKDTDGRFMLLNAAAVDALTRAQRAGILDDPNTDILAGSEHAVEVHTQEQAILCGDVPMQETVERSPHFSQDGDTWLFVTKAALTDDTGQVIGLVGINRDITPMKEAEIQLRRSHAELEQRVIERTIELQQMAEAERQQRRMAQALAESIAAMTESLTLDTVLDRILAQIARVMPPHDVSGILMLRPKNQVQAIRVCIYKGMEVEYRQSGQTYQVEDLPDIRRVLDTGQALLASTARASDPPLMHINGTLPLRSFVLMPITVSGNILGFLRLGSQEPEYFSEQDIDFLQPFTYQAAIAIQNAQLFEAVQNHAVTLSAEVEQATVELNRERRLLRAILDGMTEGVVFLDGNFQPRFANQGFAYISGYTADELENGDQFMQAMSMDMPMLQMIEHSVRRAGEQNGIWRGELRLTHKSGHEYDAAVTVTTIPGGESAGGIVLVIRDISAEKRLALQKAQFIANASHELRTPITNLKTRLYLISRQPQKLAQHIAIMENVTQRMGKLVDDLLEASRFERGQITLTRTPVMAQEVAHSVVQTQQAEAETRQIALHTDFATEPLFIHADAGRIVQVLTNLVVNAIYYINEGDTITVRVLAANHNPEPCVEYRIEDTGPGIPEEIRETLFQPFVRGTEDHSGSGLGLSISREIIELHGGTIDFTSVEGEGTIFTVCLPRIDAPTGD